MTVIALKLEGQGQIYLDEKLNPVSWEGDGYIRWRGWSPSPFAIGELDKLFVQEFNMYDSVRTARSAYKIMPDGKKSQCAPLIFKWGMNCAHRDCVTEQIECCFPKNIIIDFFNSIKTELALCEGDTLLVRHAPEFIVEGGGGVSVYARLGVIKKQTLPLSTELLNSKLFLINGGTL